MPAGPACLACAAVTPLGYHLVLRLGDDRVIAPSRALRRRWAREMAALARHFPVLAWKLADTHVHVVSLVEGTELVRRLRIWVSRGLKPGVPLEVQRHKPLAGQSHLVNAFHYALRQDKHHGLEVDVLQDASSLVDTLGLRVLTPELPTRVREHLPRLSRQALLEHLDLPVLEEAVHAPHLEEAALAAFGLDALGRDAQSHRARLAAVAAAAPLRTAAVAEALRLTPQSVCRLAHGQPPAPHVRAIRLQMCLHAATEAAAQPSFAGDQPGAAYVA